MDEARARDVLATAGVLPVPAARDARLLALGENAVFAAGGLVVKVGRDAELLPRAERELAVAGWLAEAGVPAVRAAEPKPLLADGHPVTVWHRLPDPVRPAEPRDLAGLLRVVHALPSPPFALPPRDLLGGVERWLRLAGEAIDPEDAAYLRARRDGFAAQAAALTPRLTPGPIHGDALPPMCTSGRTGRSWSTWRPSPPICASTTWWSWPSPATATGCPPTRTTPSPRRTAGTYASGRGCAVLRGARETASCAWVAQHAPSNPKALAEFERRVASLRDGDATVRWYPF